MTCDGTGNAFSKKVAARVFRDSCNALADVKNGKVHTENNSKEQVKTNEMPPQSRVARRREDRNVNVKELYAERCDVTGNSAAVEHGYAWFAVLKNNDKRDNFIIAEVNYSRQPKDTDFVVLPPNCSPDIWYLAVEECAEKIKEWVRVAKRNEVGHVEKEIPIDLDVKAYPGCITAGKGQRELFRAAIRDTYSQYAPESMKFLGYVKSYNSERFGVTITMISGKDNRHGVIIFDDVGTVEKIDESLEEFLVFANPKNLIEAREEQAKKEDLFH